MAKNTIDTTVLINQIIKAYQDAMPNACKIFKDQARQELRVQLAMSGVPGGGKLAQWGENVADAITERPVETSANSIKCIIQVPTDAGDANGNVYVQAQVLAQGNPGWMPPQTKPGQKTWNGDIDEYTVHVSGDQPPELMPESFSHGNYIDPQFMSNTGKQCADLLTDYFLDVGKSLLPLFKQLGGDNK